MRVRTDVDKYMRYVWGETCMYFMHYPGVEPSSGRLLRVYYLLLKRLLFFVFVCGVVWWLVASIMVSARRSLGGGPAVHYDSLVNKCERRLFLNDRLCGVLVSDGPNSILCAWEDSEHTHMATFLNPQIATDPVSHVISKEHVLACNDRFVNKKRGTSVTVYYNSIQHPGTVAARFVDDMKLAVCIQHAMEFPIDGPCPF
jgi:hypothetical protein